MHDICDPLTYIFHWIDKWLFDCITKRDKLSNLSNYVIAGHAQTCHAEAGHMQAGHMQAGHMQAGHAQAGHAQAGYAQVAIHRSSRRSRLII
jgi:hypothetical protein